MFTDDEFIRAFETCQLPNECFHHRDHIRLAWIYLRCYGEVEARRRIAAGIRRFAAYHGKSDKYHETITVAWLRLVADAVSRAPRNVSFEELTKAAPELLDKRTLEKFYSPAVLTSGAARADWVLPDLQPLP